MDRRDERLNSWKEIAAYLGRDASTCMKWARELGLFKKLILAEGIYSDEEEYYAGSVEDTRPLTVVIDPKKRMIFSENGEMEESVFRENILGIFSSKR